MANWERIKRAEKARDSVLDGIALSQPALALAAKILDRAAPGRPRRARRRSPTPQSTAEAGLGASLLALVAAARQADSTPRPPCAAPPSPTPKRSAPPNARRHRAAELAMKLCVRHAEPCNTS